MFDILEDIEEKDFIELSNSDEYNIIRLKKIIWEIEEMRFDNEFLENNVDKLFRNADDILTKISLYIDELKGVE